MKWDDRADLFFQGFWAFDFHIPKNHVKSLPVTAWFIIELILLALASTWITASAFIAIGGRSSRAKEMNNLYEQVLGAVRAGDLPRAILILEGEPGPLARLLSSILTESTKFTPKLRVAYKISLESLKRHGQVAISPLKLVLVVSPAIGVLGLLGPLGAMTLGPSGVVDSRAFAFRGVHCDRRNLLFSPHLCGPNRPRFAHCSGRSWT